MFYVKFVSGLYAHMQKQNKTSQKLECKMVRCSTAELQGADKIARKGKHVLAQALNGHSHTHTWCNIAL